MDSTPPPASDRAAREAAEKYVRSMTALPVYPRDLRDAFLAGAAHQRGALAERIRAMRCVDQADQYRTGWNNGLDAAARLAAEAEQPATQAQPQERRG